MCLLFYTIIFVWAKVSQYMVHYFKHDILTGTKDHILCNLKLFNKI